MKFPAITGLAPVVQTLDSAIHSIVIYLEDSAIQRLNNRGQASTSREFHVYYSQENWKTTPTTNPLRQNMGFSTVDLYGPVWC